MNRKELEELLIKNGYRKHELSPEDLELAKDGYETFGYKHAGHLYQRFRDTVEVAFHITGDEKPNVWLSIEYDDAKVETNIDNLYVANAFLTLMEADTIVGIFCNANL